MTTMFGTNIKRLQSRLGIRNVTLELVSIYLRKELYQKSLSKAPTTQQILAIWGCQRSGTSLLTRVFFRDFNVKVYRESSRLSSDDRESPGRKLRLNAFAKLQAVFAKDKAALIVLKPLVESQTATKFLDFFPNAKGLWLYRHYKDVAISSMQAFGMDVGINDLRPIVAGDQNNWRSEHVSAAVQETVRKYFSEKMNPYDAAALFWYARNRIFFELALDLNPRIMLWRYEDWVMSPSQVTEQMYRFIGLPYPGDHVICEVHAESVSRGKQINLSPPIEELCQELLAKLDGCYEIARQHSVLVPGMTPPLAVAAARIAEG